MNDAYDIAKAGGKHALWLQQLERMGDRQVEKTRKSLSDGIDIHRSKVQNPSSFADSWESQSAQYREGLIGHWEKEIATFSEQVAIAKRVLHERKK